VSAASQPKMTVDEFLVWAEGQAGRWELFQGVAYAMAPERTRHGETKFKVQAALLKGIKTAGLNCHMLPDGATVRVAEDTAHEPDALVYCGPELPGDAVEVPAPVVVVEVSCAAKRWPHLVVHRAGRELSSRSAGDGVGCCRPVWPPVRRVPWHDSD
jgi:Uma2 family endonuclease